MIINFTPFPTLITNRLILRQLDISDRDNLFKLRGDKRVNKYLDRDAPTSVGEVDVFIIKIHSILKNNAGAYWAITLKSSPDLIGTICYWNLDREKDRAEIGYELSPEHQGKGLMHEAVTEVIKYGWDKMQLKTITAVTHPDNENSTKLLSRIGFKPDNSNEFTSKEDAGDFAAYVIFNSDSI